MSLYEDVCGAAQTTRTKTGPDTAGIIMLVVSLTMCAVIITAAVLKHIRKSKHFAI